MICVARRPRLNIPTRHCDRSGCKKATQGGKPYCPLHLFDNPYARRIAKLNDEVTAEAKGAAKKKPSELDVDGVIAREILRLLHIDGQKTIERIGRDVTYLDAEGAQNYAKALHAAGLVKVGRTSRGAVTLELA